VAGLNVVAGLFLFWRNMNSAATGSYKYNASGGGCHDDQPRALGAISAFLIGGANESDGSMGKIREDSQSRGGPPQE
jgi:hypothetical protein